MKGQEEIQVEVKELPALNVAYVRHIGPYKGDGKPRKIKEEVSSMLGPYGFKEESLTEIGPYNYLMLFRKSGI